MLVPLVVLVLVAMVVLVVGAFVVLVVLVVFLATTFDVGARVLSVMDAPRTGDGDGDFRAITIAVGADAVLISGVHSC